MNIISIVSLSVIKAFIIFIICSFTLIQAQEKTLLMHQKTQKPLVLEIRFCDCSAIDMNSEAIEPTPKFLNQATSIKVGVSENEVGHVSAGGLTFGYSISPSKEASMFELAYSQEYVDGNSSQTSQSELQLGLNSWLTISSYENISDQGSEYFSIAIRLTASQMGVSKP